MPKAARHITLNVHDFATGIVRNSLIYIVCLTKNRTLPNKNALISTKNKKIINSSVAENQMENISYM